VSLRPIGFERASPDAERILQALEESSGFLTLHDKSDPEEVRSRLQLSKRAFKQAAGMLMKQGIITIEADGIRKKLHESDAQGD
jgi:predicted RNA-binding protein (virulence factor B family)